MADDPLQTYRDKRDFGRTSEPEGGLSSDAVDLPGDTVDGSSPPSAGPTGGVANTDGASNEGARFVVQKHAARRLHYDVRLEVDGVMASWAVPKGPSYDPSVRRLAVHVEDHPLDYRTFEGSIPSASYGAGTVIVWDQGSYRNDSDRDGQPISLREAIDKGHVSVWLEGEKLRGGWHLIRTGDPASGGHGQGKDNWLMIKRRDDRSDIGRDVTAEQPASVLTGRTLEEVAADEEGVGERAPVAKGAATPGEAVTSGEEVASKQDRVPSSWVPPMLAKPATVAEVSSAVPGTWLLERKLDGLRCLAVRNSDAVALWSRNRLSYTARFPDVVAALSRLAADDFAIDGELVAFDTDGRTSFSLLQRRGSSVPAVFCAFDLVHLLGRSTTGLVATERRALLAKVMEFEATETGVLETGVTGRMHAGTAGGDSALRLTDEVEGQPADAQAHACSQGWEGLVAKRRDSTYASGRSGAWCKLKCTASQELVIGGWTEPHGKRSGFGALLVGVYDGAGLRFAGKVGTGFDEQALGEIGALLAVRERPTSPFVDSFREPRAHWTDPDLVAAVSFTEWTPAGRLRHPSFEGLRKDKAALDVRRELPG